MSSEAMQLKHDSTFRNLLYECLYMADQSIILRLAKWIAQILKTSKSGAAWMDSAMS